MITCSGCKWWTTLDTNPLNQDLGYPLKACTRHDLHPMTSDELRASGRVMSGPDFSCRHAEAGPAEQQILL